MTDIVDQMLANRRLERVEMSREHALAVVDSSERHARTAELFADTDDQAMAFTAAYDGAREALVAVLATEGLRARPVSGAHRNSGIAATGFVKDRDLRD
ncbi:hypothetical protein QYM46_07445 [Brevibacterium sp. K11IcPPYGO002]|uniref:hypothetical protein n=1 Tax=Brevibacterium sp. K11IcPPYGO002 TaxID=3058837 RepID=UPI003D81C432